MTKDNINIQEKFTADNKNLFSKAFLKNLRALMAEHNYTQESLAAEAELDVNTIKNFSRKGKNVLPDYVTLSSIANVFGVSTDYLCGNEENTPLRLKIGYFRDFIRKANILGLNIEVLDDKVCFSTSNSELINAFELALDDDFENDKLLFELLGDKLYSALEYTELKKNFYLYGHLIEIDDDDVYIIDEYIEILNKTIQQYEKVIKFDGDYQEKKDEWEKTKGNPKKHISDIYFDLFYKRKG